MTNAQKEIEVLLHAARKLKKQYKKAKKMLNQLKQKLEV